MAKEIKVKFQFEKSTNGTHRFQEVNSKGDVLKTNEGAAIGTLYIRKSIIGEDAPKGLEVTITAK